MTTVHSTFHLPSRRTPKKSKRSINNDDADLICNAHLEGYLPWEIDDALNLASGTAEKILDEYGYKSRFRVPKAEYEQYPRLYMVERMSLQAIADKFTTRNRRRSASTVKVYLLMIGHYVDDDGKRRKVRIRHAGHKGKSRKPSTRKRLH